MQGSRDKVRRPVSATVQARGDGSLEGRLIDENGKMWTSLRET